MPIALLPYAATVKHLWHSSICSVCVFGFAESVCLQSSVCVLSSSPVLFGFSVLSAKCLWFLCCQTACCVKKNSIRNCCFLSIAEHSKEIVRLEFAFSEDLLKKMVASIKSLDLVLNLSRSV